VRKKFQRNFKEVWKDFETPTELRCETSGDGCGLESRPAQILVRPIAPPQQPNVVIAFGKAGHGTKALGGHCLPPHQPQVKWRQYEIQDMAVCCRNDVIRRAGHTGSGECRLYTCQRLSSNKWLLRGRSQS